MKRLISMNLRDKMVLKLPENQRGDKFQLLDRILLLKPFSLYIPVELLKIYKEESMRLKKLKIENFRGYAQETIISFEDELTAFLGRNDAGKSSILEVLEIFFNNDTVKLDIGDLSKVASSNVISITCLFDDLPDEVVVDENYPTTLQDEFLTNSEGNIEVRKEYKIQATVGKPTIFIVANHPSNVTILHLI